MRQTRQAYALLSSPYYLDVYAFNVEHTINHRHQRNMDCLTAHIPALFVSLVLLMATARKREKKSLEMWRL